MSGQRPTFEHRDEVERLPMPSRLFTGMQSHVPQDQLIREDTSEWDAFVNKHYATIPVTKLHELKSGLGLVTGDHQLDAYRYASMTQGVGVGAGRWRTKLQVISRVLRRSSRSFTSVLRRVAYGPDPKGKLVLWGQEGLSRPMRQRGSSVMPGSRFGTR